MEARLLLPVPNEARVIEAEGILSKKTLYRIEAVRAQVMDATAHRRTSDEKNYVHRDIKKIRGSLKRIAQRDSRIAKEMCNIMSVVMGEQFNIEEMITHVRPERLVALYMSFNDNGHNYSNFATVMIDPDQFRGVMCKLTNDPASIVNFRPGNHLPNHDWTFLSDEEIYRMFQWYKIYLVDFSGNIREAGYTHASWVGHQFGVDFK